MEGDKKIIDVKTELRFNFSNNEVLLSTFKIILAYKNKLGLLAYNNRSMHSNIKFRMISFRTLIGKELNISREILTT